MEQVAISDIESSIDVKTLTMLTNDNPQATEPDWDRISKLIDLSNNLIDDALRNQYPVPLKNKHSVLAGIGSEICIYNIYLIRNRHKVTEDIKNNYQNALRLLDDYSKGKKVLSGELSESPSAIKVNQRTKVFSSDVLSRY